LRHIQAESSEPSTRYEGVRIIGLRAALIAPLGLALLAVGAMAASGRMELARSHAVRVTPTAVVQSGRAPQDFDFQIDQTTLTRDLNVWAAGQPPLQTPLGMTYLADLSVEVRESEFLIHGMAQTALLHTPVDLAASASVQGERLLVQVHGAQVSGVQLPEVVRSQLEQQLQRQLDQSIAGDHVTVRSVRLGDGVLAVSGTR
jgi:hypothetical protein